MTVLDDDHARPDDVVTGLRRAGHAELADRVGSELIGRNAIAGRWTAGRAGHEATPIDVSPPDD